MSGIQQLLKCSKRTRPRAAHKPKHACSTTPLQPGAHSTGAQHCPQRCPTTALPATAPPATAPPTTDCARLCGRSPAPPAPPPAGRSTPSARRSSLQERSQKIHWLCSTSWDPPSSQLVALPTPKQCAGWLGALWAAGAGVASLAQQATRYATGRRGPQGQVGGQRFNTPPRLAALPLIPARPAPLPLPSRSRDDLELTATVHQQHCGQAGGGLGQRLPILLAP